MNANIIVPVLLFILLTPGLLFTIPSVNNGNFPIPGKYQLNTVLVHSAVFAVIYITLRTIFPKFY